MDEHWTDTVERDVLKWLGTRGIVSTYELVSWLGVPDGCVYPALRRLRRQGRIARCPLTDHQYVPRDMPKRLQHAWRLAD